MPPRIQSRRVSNALLPLITSSSSSVSSIPSLCSSSQIILRQFSVTSAPQTKLRRAMFEWLNSEGVALKHHIPGETNYLRDSRAPRDSSKSRPFPNNPFFYSDSVLSEELRNEVYSQVVEKKKTVRSVSVQFRIDMRRVAAVVRLVEMERRQQAEGKQLALPYARAVHEMIPITPLAEAGEPQQWHESVNDLPAHPSTGAQIFYPTSESRAFTRVDAGRVFSSAPAQEHQERAKVLHPSDLAEKISRNPRTIEWVGKGSNTRQVLQAADVRIPHPQEIQLELDRAAFPNEHHTVAHRHAERLERQEEIEKQRRERAHARREKGIQHLEPEGARFEYRFKDVVVSKETTGADGRAPRAPGRRYGVPHDDRKRGIVKIPTRVEV